MFLDKFIVNRKQNNLPIVFVYHHQCFLLIIWIVSESGKLLNIIVNHHQRTVHSYRPTLIEWSISPCSKSLIQFDTVDSLLIYCHGLLLLLVNLTIEFIEAIKVITNDFRNGIQFIHRY